MHYGGSGCCRHRPWEFIPRDQGTRAGLRPLRGRSTAWLGLGRATHCALLLGPRPSPQGLGWQSWSLQEPHTLTPGAGQPLEPWPGRAVGGAQAGQAFLFPLLWLLACRGGQDVWGCGRGSPRSQKLGGACVCL